MDNNWSAITSYYSANSGEANIYGTMCAHIAMARMAQHRNDTTTMNTAVNNLTTAFNDGKTFTTIDNRCKNTYYGYWYNDARVTQTTYHGFAFLNLSPEVGRYLKDYVSTDVLARTDQGKAQYPLWWVLSSDYIEEWTGIEGSGHRSEMAGMVFPVEKWVRQAAPDTLAGWMKSAPEGKGDCYWLENLVQAIEGYGTLNWTERPHRRGRRHHRAGHGKQPGGRQPDLQQPHTHLDGPGR